MCVCVREREREREKKSARMIVRESKNSMFPAWLDDIVFRIYFGNLFTFATVNIGSISLW